jgi:hypothetical protein
MVPVVAPALPSRAARHTIGLLRGLVIVALETLRRQRGWTALLVVVVGIAVGMVLAGFAGARRTDSAIPAFVRASGGADAYASFALNGATAPPDFGPEVARLRAIPGVRDARRFANAVVVATDRAAFGGGQALLATIGIDPGGLALFGRPKVIAGRLPRDDVAEETAIDEALARGVGLHVGSTYRLQAYTMAQLPDSAEGKVPPQGPRRRCSCRWDCPAPHRPAGSPGAAFFQQPLNQKR